MLSLSLSLRYRNKLFLSAAGCKLDACFAVRDKSWLNDKTIGARYYGERGRIVSLGVTDYSR